MRTRIDGRLLALLVTIAALLATPAGAGAEVDAYTNTTWSPSHLLEGKSGRMMVEVNNRGNTATSISPPVLKVQIVLPPNTTFSGITPNAYAGTPPWTCSGVTTVTCSAVTSLPGYAGNLGTAGSVGQPTFIMLELSVGAGVTGTFPMTITTTGGGMSNSSVETRMVTISDTPLGFGIHALTAGAFDESGEDYFLAGGHPDTIEANFSLNVDRLGVGGVNTPVPSGGAIRDVVVDTPPGFIGDPTAVPQCSEEQLQQQRDLKSGNGCPTSSQVGYVLLRVPQIGNVVSPVYNMVPPGKLPARFAFWTPVGTVRVSPSVRSDGDYGLTTTVTKITQADVLLQSRLVLWGNPADPRHDAQRCAALNIATLSCVGVTGNGVSAPEHVPHPFEGQEDAFLSLQTNCVEEPVTVFNMSRWEDPAPFDDLDDPRWFKNEVTTPTATECEQVPFEPSITLRPTSRRSDSPTGLDVHLKIPRERDSDPEGRVQAHLKKTTVVLPEGLVFNASAADGLAACSSEQMGLTSAIGATPIRFDNREPSCPDASKIGTGEVTTPLLDRKLRGEVFLAAQGDNPFGSTYAVYIVVREPSILVKLAGLVEPDPRTGRLTTTFDQNPQLPFSDFELSFYSGDRSALVTPTSCGDFTSRTELVPWSAQDPESPTSSEVTVIEDPFAIDAAPPHGACAPTKAQLPFALGFEAGTRIPVAAAHSPLQVRITRPDGNQEIDRIEITTPMGLTGSLRDIPYCSEGQIAGASRNRGRAEQASPSCPKASQLGTTTVGAGAGPNPVYVSGKIYLAGPYKGAPISLAVIVPAVAGPFDLGVQVVRAALRVDPGTTQITAVSDPIPQILDGAPLRIQDVRVSVDRPGFILNPSGCSERQLSATVFGVAGARTELSNRFQVGSCRDLRFKPGIKLQLLGGTRRGAYQGVRAVIRPRPGDSNISRAVVRFPSSAFVAQEHLTNICTRVQWAAEACPRSSIYGRAVAWSPLLDYPLKGNVHLRSSDNLLPDLVADLRGPTHQPVKIEVAINTDSAKGVLRNTVKAAPDAPVSFFRLQTFGGNKGLIINSRNVCRGRNAARVAMRAHNARRITRSVPVRNRRCAKQRRAAKRKRAKHRRAAKQKAANKRRAAKRRARR